MKKGNNPNEKITIGVNNYVEHSMSILDRIHELLDKKFNGKQNELAKKLGKRESEVSKWLNGVQNFTIFTISKLEEVFESPIISVHTEDEYNSTFVQVQLNSNISHIRFEVDYEGDVKEVVTKYEDLKPNPQIKMADVANLPI
jgi:transcriptional regulator with XRE-family HTH domain